MSKKFLRIKFEGSCVMELPPDAVEYLNIAHDPEMGEHMLIIGAFNENHVVCIGTFHKCHELLNKLHDALDIQLIDI